MPVDLRGYMVKNFALELLTVFQTTVLEKDKDSRKMC